MKLIVASIIVVCVLSAFAYGSHRKASIKKRRSVLQAATEARGWLDRLGVQIHLLEVQGNPTARQALGNAAQRFAAAGAQTGQATSAAQYRLAQQTAYEGMQFVWAANSALGLTAGPEPHETSGSAQIGEPAEDERVSGVIPNHIPSARSGARTPFLGPDETPALRSAGRGWYSPSWSTPTVDAGAWTRWTFLIATVLFDGFMAMSWSGGNTGGYSPRNVRALQRPKAPDRPSPARTARDVPQSGEDVVVAVRGQMRHDGDAVEWAAAEAAARSRTLRIVQPVNPPTIWNCTGFSMQEFCDVPTQQRADRFMEQAVNRAHAIDPGLRVDTQLVSAIDAGATTFARQQYRLLVLSARRSLHRPLAHRISVSREVLRACGPVAVVRLSDPSIRGPSASRIVVGIDHRGGSTAAILFAFDAAAMRGVGLTAVHGCPWSATATDTAALTDDQDPCACGCQDVWQTLALHSRSFPHVDVIRRLATATPAEALIAESAGAAMVVIGAGFRGRIRGAIFPPLSLRVWRSAHTTVVVVPTPSLEHQSM